MNNITDLINKLNDKSDIDIIVKAYEYAKKEHKGVKRLSGDDFITHPLEVANILVYLGVDNKTIVAALLHEVTEYGSSSFEDIKKNFGEDVAKIVESLTKINKLELTDKSESSAIYLRKILVGMAEDVRVLYIKLADRLHNMRTNWAINPVKQKDKARDTMNILVPIAHRLGMNWIKSELENISLQYLKPDVYEDILEKLNATVKELNDELTTMKNEISLILKDNDVKFEIKGRVKSVHSIYSKLSTGRKWSDIYDILALRVFVEKESDCYTVVGLIHSKFKPIAKRFKDYVASPKANMYQSLHTSVIGPGGKLYEIQIRTYEMDIIAEKGIASHWSYKEKGSKKIQNIMEQKLEMFRNIIESNNESNDVDFEKNLAVDFLNENIYCYTPKGDVVELPKGATPIDFAYRIHTSVGNSAVGAIVNEQIVQFTHELSDGDVISIKTSNTAKPNKDWLNIVKTTQAKNKIKSYFSKESKLDYIAKGKSILEKEVRKKKLSFDEVLNEENVSKIIKDLKVNDLEDIYLAIGTLRYTAGYIINLASVDKMLVQDVLLDKTSRLKNKKLNHKNDIIVDGEADVLVSLAKCCNPVKGDEIVGYITKGQGVSIHKKSCVNIDLKNNRNIEVTWNENSDNEFITKLYINTTEDFNILPNLIEVCTKKDISIASFNIIKINNKEVYEIEIRVKNASEIETVINAIERLDLVKEVTKKVK